MFRRTVSAVIIAMLLTSILTVAFNVQPVETELSPLAIPKESAAIRGTINVASQEPPITEWNKTYGGASYEGAFSVVQTRDGGYALAGYTLSFGAGQADFYLVKTDGNGVLQWNKTYGGSGDDYAWTVVQTNDDGYAMAGWTNSFGAGGWDFWLVKTDASGNAMWNKTYGAAYDDEAFSAVQTTDGGYAIAGEKDGWPYPGDFWLVKTDATGNMEWNKTYGFSGPELAYSVVQTSDGGYAMAGTGSFGGAGGGVWLVKTDTNGNMQWNKNYGVGSGDLALSVVQTRDSGYAMTGWTGSACIWLAKTAADGNMEWNKTYGGGTTPQAAFSVVQARDDGYAIAGQTASDGGGGLLKTDSDGNIQWNSTFGEAPIGGMRSVVQTRDGGYAIAGVTSTGAGGLGDFWLVKVSASSIDSWPMFHHDPSHTGYSTSTGPTSNKTLWTYTTGSAVDSSPAVVGGLVYVGSWDNCTYCLDTVSGTLVWSFKTGDRVNSSPAVVDWLVYVESMDGNVYCLNATTGSLVWSYTLGGSLWTSPAVVDGLVYVGSNDGNVYCLNATTGAFIWSYTTGSAVSLSSPAVANGLLYVGSYDHNVYCVNAATGAFVWSYTTGGTVLSSPAVAGGLVYVGSFDANVYCLNATTGSLVWSYWAGGIVFSSPAVAGGLVYVGSRGMGFGMVHSLNATTGSPAWNPYITGGYVESSPAVAGGLVYVGSFDDKKVYCLDAATGTLVWSYTLGGFVGSSPAVVNGVVYVGSFDGKIYAFGGLSALDFSLTASLASLTIQQGSLDLSTIAITSINGFNQPVQLSVSGAPSGVTATLRPSQATPPADGLTSSTLTVVVDTTATPGSYTLTVTGTNGTLTHSVGISLTITQVGEWSFAIITDLHIGWGYCDYGMAGYDDPNLGTTQDYWLTSRLEKVVEKISETKNAQNIKFVVVLGDIADTAEKSEFLKAREILGRLNDPNGDGDITDGIPYIPVIGNHDIWPYTMTQGIDPDTRDEKYVATAVDKTNYNPDNLGDRYFQKIFWEDQESQNNRDLITRLFGSSWERQPHNSAPYLQNYKFRFGDMSFVCLDFNPRDPSMAYPNSPHGELVQPFDETRDWFETFLTNNANKHVVVLCHHPFSFLGGFTDFFGRSEFADAFNEMHKRLRSVKQTNNVMIAEFGGHTHYNSDSFSDMADWLVETEAVFQESSDIIRIAKVNGQAVEDYGILQGVPGDPGLSLFFTLGTGDISNDQSVHFLSHPVDFMDIRWPQKKNVDITRFFFRWDFGDGEHMEGWGNPDVNGDADDPYHSYMYAGLYLLNLTIGTPGGVIKLNEYPIFISGELSPMRNIAGLPENTWAVSTGRDVSVKKADGDGQNTFESILISKVASPETPIVEFGVHFENATEDIDLSTFVADVSMLERKAFFHMPTWPNVIEESKILYIPSTGAGAVYICLNATSMDEVKPENADFIINVGETQNGITVTTTSYNGTEYYLVYGVTGTGGGEFLTANGGGGRMPYLN